MSKRVRWLAPSRKPISVAEEKEVLRNDAAARWLERHEKSPSKALPKPPKQDGERA